MIKDREMAYYHQCLHTTKESGYSMPDFRTITEAYGINYKLFPVSEPINGKGPLMIEIYVDSSLGLSPFLPRGKRCQDMEPALFHEKHTYLDNLQ